MLAQTQVERPSPTPAPTKTALSSLPRFEPGDCQFYPAHIANVTCGYLYVPENRQEEDTREIRLHVAIASSYNENPQPDPVIALSGGPGSWALEWLYRNLSRYTDILNERDVIFFDPRGVGYSQPSLDCPEVENAFYETLDQAHSAAEIVENNVDAHLACRQRLLRDGVDLPAYNSLEMAADVNDLRRALGYDQVNLLGVSYGTRTALTMMRDYPQSLRTVVLDSPVPLEAGLFGGDALNADQALTRLFERCAADPDCSSAYSDLPADFEQLTAKLETNPITIPVSHLVTHKLHQVGVDGSILGAAVVESLYDYEMMVELPRMIDEALAGETDRLASSLQIYLLNGQYASEGLRQSVLCGDEGSFTTLESAAEKTTGVRPAIAGNFAKEHAFFFQVCDAWGTETADPVENQAVVSDVPTLVLSGELDPATPPAWGKQVAGNLLNTTYVEFPGLGHSLFAEHNCAREIIAGYLMNPDALPDLDCIDATPYKFDTP